MVDVKFSLPCRLDKYFELAEQIAAQSSQADIDHVWNEVSLPDTPWRKEIVFGLLMLTLNLAEMNGITEKEAYTGVEILLQMTNDADQTKEEVMEAMFINIKDGHFTFGLTEKGVALGKQLHDQALIQAEIERQRMEKDANRD
jgi:hypothetical protein